MTDQVQIPGDEPGKRSATDSGTGAAERSGHGWSRRSVLRGGLLVGAGAIGGGLIGGFSAEAVASPASTSDSGEPFLGPHQSGIVTNTQRSTVLAAFDLTSSARGDLVALMKAWTRLGAELVTAASVTVPIYTSPSSSNADAYADATGTSTTDDSFEAYEQQDRRGTARSAQRVLGTRPPAARCPGEPGHTRYCSCPPRRPRDQQRGGDPRTRLLIQQRHDPVRGTMASVATGP